MTSIDSKSIVNCTNCGSKRCYELQLMPALLQGLTIEGQILSIDVGTVLLYTCANNCWSADTLTEQVIVQHDPDEHLLDKLNQRGDSNGDRV